VPETVPVAFTLNGESVRLRVAADRRLLDVLREDLRLTGAKEGCGKGECGSCTVLLDERPVASCLVMAYQADGAVIETIEGLAQGPQLHPLQKAFLEAGASQCGVCMPGMVLAAKACLASNPAPGVEEIRTALAGNLCRCTGYAKIVQAVARAGPLPQRPAPPATPGAAPGHRRPRSLEEALEVLTQRAGEAVPLAGGTDLLVRAKDGRLDPAAFFDLTAVPELKGIHERDRDIWIGAGATHAEMAASGLLARWVPALPQACAIIGGPQVRNRGTLGGNLANASPAADTVPPLLVADAVVELVSVSARREVPLAELCTGPGATVLAPDELILGVRVPKRPGVRAAFLRLGQRRAQAISKVSLAAAMTFRDGRPETVRIALGAVAPTAFRARAAEAALLAGGPAALAEAKAVVRTEVEPIDDLRSSATYRREMAGVLLERAVRRLAEA
jgi:carbon-monoxide dehydrogenase small subunit/xanthine dehydrogenase small subunit